ncbi:UNVERIFIED_CONTAM: hypothetical protein FKN15_048792 [Acipenser sinensis]
MEINGLCKVAVKKEDLQKYHGRDTWFQFQHVDADSEVQGKVHLELRLSEVITDSGVVCHKLAARMYVSNMKHSTTEEPKTI